MQEMSSMAVCTAEITQPHSIELEQQILGAILANNDRYHRIGSWVTAEHFYDGVHGDIWRNISGRIEKDHPASPSTLKADLEAHDGLQELGGSRYLVRLVGASISGSMVVEYAKEMVELWRRRQVLQETQAVSRELSRGGHSDEAVARLELFLAEQEATRVEPRAMSLLKAHTESVSAMVEAYQGGVIGIPTGVRALDEALVLKEKRYTIAAAATSMGKSAFGAFAAKSAAESGYGVSYVTLEMSETDLANRINSIDSRVPYKAMDRPMSEGTLRKVVETAKQQEALPIQILSSAVRDVPAILSECKRIKQQWVPNEKFRGLKLLIIDYIQLLRGKGSNEFHALSKIANDLKQVAKQLDVHVLALAQVDRRIGDRDDTRPRLSDLRGSGDLENAPDNVIFLHRPEYYLERQLQGCEDFDLRVDIEAKLSAERGVTEVIIAKARMGELGLIRLRSDMATNRFWTNDGPPPETAEM